jgi:hypothetical protein
MPPISAHPSRDPVVQELSRRLVAERGVAAPPIVKDSDMRKEVDDRGYSPGNVGATTRVAPHSYH